MARRGPQSPTLPSPRPSDRPATSPERSDAEDEGYFPVAGERLRRLALGLTTTLIVMRPYWPSEDAATGTGLSWVLASLAVAAVAIIAGLLSGTARWRWSWADAAFLGLVALVGLSASHAADRRGAINLAWEWAGIAVVYLLVRNLPRTRGESAAVAGALLASAVAVAVYGLYQGFVELPAVKRAFLANAPNLMREMNIEPGSASEALFRSRVLDSKEPFATFALPNSLAGFLVGALALALAVAADNLRREGRGSRSVALAMAAAPAAALMICLLMTKSRSAWIGLAVALGVIAWRSLGRISGRTIAVAAVGLAVVLGGLVAGLAAARQLDLNILTESTKSLRYRWEYWKGTWAVLTNAPNPFEPRPAGPVMIGEALPNPWPEEHAFLWGLGPGNFAGAYLRHKLPEASEEILDPHNLVLEVWATAGLPAALALLAALGLGVWQTLRPSREAAEDDSAVSSSASKRAPDPPPASPAWLIPFGAAAWIAVLLFGKLDPFDPRHADLLGRWFLLGVGWIAAVGLGAYLWRRRPIPAAGAGVAVLAIAINLLAAGGIGVPGVALTLWVLLALGLNLRDDLPSGTLRERRGIGRLAIAALIWAGAVGAFWGAIAPFWRSEILTDRGEALMEKSPPAYEKARELFLAAAEADRANVRPRLDQAELEFAYWKSPGGRGRAGYWERVFLALDEAIQGPWRDPYSLHVRRLQSQYARMILQSLRESAPIIEPIVIKAKVASATRRAAQLYPTSPALRAQLAQASAEFGQYADAVSEAETALRLSDLTPHLDKKLPEDTVRDLKAKIPDWTLLRDNPPKPPNEKAAETGP